MVSAWSARLSAVLRADGILRQSVLVFSGLMALNLGSVAFHALASRLLGVAHYGTLYTLISLITLMLLPAALLAPVVTRFAAEFSVRHDARHLKGLWLDLGRFCAVAIVLYIATSLLVAMPAAAYLGVPTWGLPAVGVIAACSLVTVILRSVCQGLQDFRGYAISTTAEGIARIVTLLVLGGGLGLGLFGGVLGFFGGTACGLIVIAWQLVRRFKGVVAQRIRYDWRRIAWSGAGVAAITLATTCLGSVDVIVVKRFFSSSDAGLYAAAALGGKTVLYLVAFVPAVMLPRVTERYARGERTRAAFSESLSLLLVLVVCALIAVRFFGQSLLHALVGHAFDAALPLLMPYAGAMMLLAITNLLASYGVATHRLSFAAPLVAGTLGTLALIGLAHPSLYAVACELLAGNALICVLVVVAVASRSVNLSGS